MVYLNIAYTWAGNMYHKHAISHYATYIGHVHLQAVKNSVSDKESFACTRVCSHMAHACVWVIKIRWISVVYRHAPCICMRLYQSNYTHPRHIVPRLATDINHSQHLLTKYCAFDSLLAMVSTYQVLVECMTRIWRAAMAYLGVPYALGELYMYQWYIHSQ